MNKNIVNDETTTPTPNPETETLLVGRAYTWSYGEDKSHINFKIIVGPEKEHSDFRAYIIETARKEDKLADLIFVSDYLFSYDVRLFLHRDKY